jgi:hypothetical protein
VARLAPKPLLCSLLVLAACSGGSLGTAPHRTPGGPSADARAAAPPPPGECPSVVGTPILEDGKGLVDAPPVLLKEGMTVEADQLLMLRRLLPPVIWQHREVFFYEGMRMEIGGCHERYPVFSPYRAATDHFRGRPSIDGKGNLENYTAGLPFPPEEIDPQDPQAAVKWAWNLEQRFRGAGFRGSFRITEIPARIGGILTYEGKHFFVQTGHRTDRPDDDYTVGDQPALLWAAGGLFQRPFDARHLAWRQFRTDDSQTSYREPDDVFVYVPSMRKQRRAATNWVDGLFMPTYTGGNEGAGGGMPFGEGGSISPTAGLSIATSEDMGHGLTGITLRPNAYVWRYLGEQTILAPLNATRDGYPLDPKRNFGFSGLSVASDRWDVRHAVIIEGALRVPNSDVRTVEVWVDYQTQQPLYWITRTGRRRLLDIGILVHRFTGDRSRYPEWPGGFPANIFEPVGATFYNAIAGGGGWRRESYDLVSTPFTDSERRKMTSADNLAKGR